MGEGWRALQDVSKVKPKASVRTCCTLYSQSSSLCPSYFFDPMFSHILSILTKNKNPFRIRVNNKNYQFQHDLHNPRGSVFFPSFLSELLIILFHIFVFLLFLNCTTINPFDHFNHFD